MGVVLSGMDTDDWSGNPGGAAVPAPGWTRRSMENEVSGKQEKRNDPGKPSRLNEDQLEAVIESSDAVVALQDLEGRILYYHGPSNQGPVAADVIGKVPADLLDSGTAAAIMVRERHIVSTGCSLTFEQRFPVRNGALWFLVQMSPVVDRSDRVTGVVTFARDITDRKLMEESLKRANVLLEKTFGSLSEAVFVLHPASGKIVTCNTAVERIFGFRKEEVTGRAMDFLHVDDEAYGEFWDAMTAGLHDEGVFRGEFENRRKDGSVLFTEYTVTATADDEEHHTGLVCVVRDMTERKRMVDELLRARKLESIGILAGGIAHDFNNLLTAILGNLSMVKMHLPPGDKNNQRLEDAEKACSLASALTSKLITFSNGGLPARRVNLTPRLLGEAVAHALGDSGVAYALDVAPGLVPVDVNEDQIRQVIGNIVQNAIEAMPDGGTVHVHAENVRVEPRHRLSVAEGRCLRVSIQDEGIGIPADHLSKIFDPYFTTKELGSTKGTGLGLAVCYSVVKNHNGCIAVDSEPGHGSTFHIYLPAREEG